ncbi:HEPN domain-containing protein [Microbacterium karelineae]|uniref:HEPN domain-containing protein n=1 Tax=Microbacterium karelineae TaxID=2654283 RepID=UPI0012EA537C|nr:HEPN domain-containing protein [Microbacterium karelineae]
MPDVIEQMLTSRRLERIEPNVEHSLAVVQMAERHVATAKVLEATEDHGMAFTAAYDGARKALTAVLAIEGLRVRPVGGAHRNTGIAAAAFVDDPSFDEFDWMRQVRNATEYPDLDRPTATAQDVAEAIDAGGAIVAACAVHVRGRG